MKKLNLSPFSTRTIFSKPEKVFLECCYLAQLIADKQARKLSQQQLPCAEGVTSVTSGPHP